MKKLNLIIDFNNLSMRIRFTKDVHKIFENFEEEKDKLKLYNHIIFNSINSFFKKAGSLDIDEKILKNKEIILAIDSKSWRKNLFEIYKANRTKKPEEQHIWDFYYSYVHDFLDQIKENMNWSVIKSDMAEADDVIAVLIQTELNTKDDINVIISADKDFKQFLNFELNCEVHIYDPLKEIFLEKEENVLLKMILAGDKSDNIPAIKPKLGPKTAEKIIKENKLEDLLKDINLQSNFNTNKKLISLDVEDIPEFVVKSIKKEYQKIKNIPKVNQITSLMFLKSFNQDVDDLMNLI